MADADPPAGAGLGALFRARSIALVGATERSFWSQSAFANCGAIGFDGRVHMVNPKGGIIHGQAAATSCAAIGEPVDAALLMVPMAAMPATFADLAASGIRNAVILTAGFAETGEEGRDRQAAMAAAADAHGITLLGPNCLGFLNLLDRVAIWTSSVPPGQPGSVAIVSQSGAVASYITDYAVQQGVGIGYIVSTGNEADLNSARVIDFLLEDPRIGVVAAFLETARDAATLAVAAERARAAGKAIVALKIGSGSLTAAAAQAHTGSLVGDDGVFTAACRRHNIVRAHSIEELVATADMIARVGRPRAPQLGVISISGGICEIASDRGELVGAPMAPFAAATTATLAELMPDYGTANNPLDVTGAAVTDPSLFGRVVRAVAGDTEIGLAAVLFDAPAEPSGITHAIMAEIGGGAAGAGAPAVMLSTAVHPVGEAVRAVATACGVEVAGHGIEHGMAALAHLFRWGEGLARPTPGAWSGSPGARPDLAGERATLDYLEGRGVPVVPGVVVRDAEAAARAAVGTEPMAFKIASPDIQHKSDVGGVVLNVAGEAAAREAFAGIMARVAGAAPKVRLDGVLVSPMRPAGLELIVGVVRDPDWGPAIAVGLGGVWVEALKDTSLRLLPIDEAEALTMLGELRATKLLDGYRGTPAADRAAIARAVVAIGEVALALGPELASLEVNPLWVRGGEVEALDALALWDDPA